VDSFYSNYNIYMKNLRLKKYLLKYQYIFKNLIFVNFCVYVFLTLNLDGSKMNMSHICKKVASNFHIFHDDDRFFCSSRGENEEWKNLNASSNFKGG
jgi:hypothetical protein